MSRTADTELPLLVLKKFRLIFGTVRQHFREVEQTCGVSGSQLWILQEVLTAPHIGVSELAGKLSIHQSTCSQLVEKLVSRGFLTKERSKEDQRRVGLSITKTARKIVDKAPGPASGVLPEALGALSTKSLANLDAALAEVIRKLEIDDEQFAGKPLADL